MATNTKALIAITIASLVAMTGIFTFFSTLDTICGLKEQNRRLKSENEMNLLQISNLQNMVVKAFKEKRDLQSEMETLNGLLKSTSDNLKAVTASFDADIKVSDISRATSATLIKIQRKMLDEADTKIQHLDGLLKMEAERHLADNEAFKVDIIRAYEKHKADLISLSDQVHEWKRKYQAATQPSTFPAEKVK